MWASTLWPFCSSTRKVALRRHSRTVPSSSMPFDFLAMIGASFGSGSAEDQFEGAAGAPGADALEQRHCGHVGFGRLGQVCPLADAVLADALQGAQGVGQQRPRYAAPLAVGPDGGQPDPRE